MMEEFEVVAILKFLVSNHGSWYRYLYLARTDRVAVEDGFLCTDAFLVECKDKDIPSGLAEGDKVMCSLTFEEKHRIYIASNFLRKDDV